MRVVDTNVVVRYLANDNPGQSARARRLFAQHNLFVPLTVLLESEWVLRSAFGLPPADVIRGLRALAGLARVTIESPGNAAAALDWAEQGMDFAAALHLATAQQHDGFVTFDKALARTARKLDAPPVSEP
jgi:predicted nucleic acid-binding protein